MADKIGIDDVVEQAAAGVLRALEARNAGRAAGNSADYVKSGFNVEFVIRAGGLPAGPFPFGAVQSARTSAALGTDPEPGR